jgi:hemerythrin superfamily protein
MGRKRVPKEIPMNHGEKRSSGGNDVIDFLKGQHEQIKGMFEDVIAAKGPAREKLFRSLQSLMTAHEAAEEKVVHPAAKRTIEGGAAEVAARLAEEAEAKKTLAALDKLDVRSAEFETTIKKLRGAVLRHAKSEEKEEFDQLAGELDANKLKAMREQVVAVEADASKG